VGYKGKGKGCQFV